MQLQPQLLKPLERGCALPTFGIFAFQLFVSVAAFVGITVMFVVSGINQLDHDADAISQVNLKYINVSIGNPVQAFVASSVAHGDLILTDAASYSDALVSNMSDPELHRMQFAMYRGAVFQQQTYGGMYQLFDTGAASSINPAVNAVTESRCDQQTCRITDAAGRQTSWYMPAAVPNVPATFHLSTPFTSSTGVLLAA